LSFAFIDTKDRLTKPFATPPATPAATPGTEKPSSPTPDAKAIKIIETLAQAPDTYESIKEMSSVGICRAEVKAGEKNTVSVTLHVKDPAVLPKLQEAVAKSAAEALNARVKASITPNPPAVTSVGFGQNCK
jgi:hypothetical protein